MPAYALNILDAFGNRVAVVNGVSLGGPATGMRNLTYHPRGAILSNSGQIAFEIPMAVRRNLAIAPGAQVEVVSDRWGHEGTYVVTDKSETIVEEGHFAQFTCPDLLEELRWQIVPGYSAAAGETVTTTATNLLKYQTETVWQANVTTAATADGFLADGATVQAAIGTLAGGRFCSYRLNGTTTRRLDIGAFRSVSSGLRLQRPGGAPNQSRRASLVNITSFAQNADASGVVNCIAPTGPGTGDAALTLRSVWNPTGATTLTVSGQIWQMSGPLAFPGYDANYHLYRRVKGNRNPATDGDLAYQYFLYDAASVATYRQRWLPYLRTDITPISSNPGDLTVAAQALYQASLAYLKWHNAQSTVLTLQTDGTADLRGIAGQTVHVYWSQVANGIQTVLVNGDYQVIEVSRAVADTGASIDTWKLSTTGQDVVSSTSLLVGALTQISNASLIPQIYPGNERYSERDYIDSNNPVSFVIYGNLGIIQRVSASLIVEPVPIKLTGTTTTSVDHSHSYTIPALDVNIPSLTVNLPSLAVNLPSLIVNIPTLVVNLPSLAVNLPSLIVNLPSLNVNLPALAVSLPSLTVAIPALTVYSQQFPIAGNQYVHTHGNGVNDFQHNHGNISGGSHNHGISLGSHSHAIVGTKPFVDLTGVGAVHTGTVSGTTVVTSISGTSSTADHTHGEGGITITTDPSAVAYGGFAIGMSNQLGGVPQFGGFGTLSTYPTNIQTPATGQLGGGQGSTTAGALPGAVPASGNGNPTGNTTSSANAGGQGSTIASGQLGGGQGSVPASGNGNPTGNTTSSANAGGQGSTIPSGSPGGAQGSTIAQAAPGATVPVGTGSGNAGSTTSVSQPIMTGSGGAHFHIINFGVGTGPSPATLAVAIDGVSVATGITAVTPIDILKYINDQNNHTVTITSTGAQPTSIGGVRWTFIGRHRESTVKV